MTPMNFIYVRGAFLYSKLWNVHSKSWNVYSKAWNIKNITEKRMIGRVIKRFVGRHFEKNEP